MKKINLTLCAILCAVLSSTAQDRKSINNFSRQLVSELFKKQESRSAGKATSSVHERVIAQSAYSPVYDHSGGSPVYVWGIADSEAYVYSGGRSSTFDFGFMAYFHQYSPAGNRPWLLYNTAGMVDYNGITYNVFSDKYYRWMPDPNTTTGGYTFIDSGTAIYNATDKLLWYEDMYQNSLYSSSRFANTYNSSGDLQSSLFYIRDNTTLIWHLIEDRYYAYNAINDLTCDSVGRDTVGVSLSSGKFLYTYSSPTNDLILVTHYARDAAGYWNEDKRYNVAYYGTGRIQKVSAYDVDLSGVLTIKQIDSFGWTSGVSYYTYFNERQYDLSGVSFEITSSKHINTTMLLPDTVYSQTIYPTFGVGDTSRSVFTYNSNFNPILAVTHRYNAATGAFDSLNEIRHFYYEIFFPDNVVNVEQANGMFVYPNPTSSALNIVFDDLTGGTGIHIKLVNTVGQVVYDEDTQYTGSVVRMSFSNMPPGIYWLVVEDKGSKKQYRQSVVKQ